ncbi:MAG TPA: alpha-1,4-glucan--maltose-1-phosphate maltosyltransferase [Candidatus Limnocylindrales bacterium]|nr:alpha-1,4-glucan--maltose-1-phosphate maltosyltransferase [Candidatus Limnocylindrales bacterium]
MTDRPGPGDAIASASSLPSEGRTRVVIEDVGPSIDGGRFPIKRVVGETVVVECDAFADGHDEIAVRLRHRRAGTADWRETPMVALGNDRFRGSFEAEAVGRHEYAVVGWIDRFGTWRRDLRARLEADQDVSIDVRIGADLVDAAAAGASVDDRAALERWAYRLRADEAAASNRARDALQPALAELIAGNDPRPFATQGEPILEVVVDPVHARFGTWYELFPRSTSPDAGRHGTFRDVIARLPYVVDLGFDVLYLPPIHPIGRQFRKGANNSTEPEPGAPGVPWAIGGLEGGHTAIHPELGTLDDFHALVDAAADRGVRIALDLAFQASPDHPFVRDHPSWFRARPDGTIQYAENPPKKYQDIYPFDFETEDWRGLWAGLLDVTRFWIRQGVRIFRVDNPHTKPFGFWEWFIGEIKASDPDVLFLAEAFTRPKVMYRLAKLGFSQSYTYFTWRTTTTDLRDYFTELTAPPVRDFFRPNVWPNTPDILHETLQVGGRSAFQARFVLAATLAASYGIYGPAFELGERVPREPGSEEYLHSEKYEIRHWDLESHASIAPLIRRVNAIRHAHPALQTNDGLAFHETGDDQVLAYTKRAPARHGHDGRDAGDGDEDVILAVVTLEPQGRRSVAIDLPVGELGLDPQRPVQADDLLRGGTIVWHDGRATISLDPADCPAAILHLRSAAADRAAGSAG